MKKKLTLVFIALISAVSLASCGTQNEDDRIKVAMVSDTGGINDQSFNESAWEGLQKLEDETGAKVSYVESTQASDYATNLDRLEDSGNDLIWGIGFSLADSVVATAKENPDVSYALADFNLGDSCPDNVTSVDFAAQESSFLVGYIAGRTTKTNKVGFIGGIDSIAISRFKFGYLAGVKFAAKELGKNIDTPVQYAESFSDSATGKAIASKMYSDGCDIIFHASGKTGDGVFSAAIENGKYAIGVDKDQSDKAPKNILVSAMKHVGKAVRIVSKEFIDNKKIGGKNYSFGLRDGCVGIPTKDKCPLVEDNVYNDTLKLQDRIIAEEITVPFDKNSYETFLKNL